ncbi:hypothetical protein COW80_00555 [Candidatus Beckwithbacteria bacterium CG22_combo_CG10-13_8_21_14_all_01_47_9]|uniref:Lipid II isoglutaminyl synthase (glutamine-hydrolyzing) subunit MurT n=2 Tax=Candidatus Beckwithiibacteriota TaxID=1752726 RepID=A0A2H0E3I6_9BACT|nr:MAG: hypothetical protein COW80_00555 [Candidatus Beckwithbacteria bacterium CG22_combo_CG10-13_8_21_14_all_01_47_9]PJC66788.1 MAG: hypothetical protein CO018_00095 [Candidatus Beckwithbacteria bacterium CG_4_9_14_0_2_um_filter_47_11]
MSSPMLISLIISKFIAGFGGTALPGLIGLRLTPTLINQIVKKNKLASVVVTGTNGKTTTSRLLGAVLTESKINFCHNRSGSNLLRGIATALINQSNWLGKIKSKLAICEVDEAAAPAAIRALKPKIIVFTNISRDQLDRYGEVDHLLKLWQKSLDTLPSASRVLVNAADRRLKILKHPRLTYFGSSLPGAGLMYPPRYGGKFNQDSLWAIEAVCRHLDLDPKLAAVCAQKTKAAFGRGEVFKLDGQKYQINLVKNPASFKAVWQMLADRRHLNQPFMLALNDKLADGTDVSWIWDVPFTGLGRRRKPIIVTGTRASDLALRLKYAGCNPKNLFVEPKIYPALAALRKIPGTIKYILPTYTALLELRQSLGKQAWN